MNKRARNILCIALLCVSISQRMDAQSAKQLLYNFCPDTAITSGNSALYADDSFFVAIGQTSNAIGTDVFSYVATFDYNLNLLHKKYIHFPGTNNMIWGNSTVTKIGYNRYVMTGVEMSIRTSTSSFIYQPYLFIFNKNLDSINSLVFYDTTRIRFTNCVVGDKQKNFLLSGLISSTSMTYNPHSGGWDYDSSYVWIDKYDSNANLIWHKEYFPQVALGDYAYKVIPAHDSISYIVAGYLVNNFTGRYDGFIMRIDSAGNVVWKKWLFMPFPMPEDYEIDVTALNNKDYAFVSSYSDSLGPGGPQNSHVYYGRVSENGDSVWARNFNDYGKWMLGRKITVTEENELLILAYRLSDISSDIPIIIKTDSNGKIEWYREYLYRNSWNFSAFDIVSFAYLPSKQILMTGELGRGGPLPGIFDTTGALSWYMLTDTFGCMDPGCEVGDSVWKHVRVPTSPSLSKGEVTVWPNPVSDKLVIENADESEVVVTDITGKRIATAKINSNHYVLQIPDVVRGVYLVYVTSNDERRSVFKIIKK